VSATVVTAVLGPGADVSFEVTDGAILVPSQRCLTAAPSQNKQGSAFMGW
jgi:hypothetical protein